jgi:protein phosphatase
MTRIALIADIHGNVPALEAVLDDIGRVGADEIYCLGDIVGKGGSSDRAVDICRATCALNIYGNWEDSIANGVSTSLAAQWYRAQLGEERCAWLRALPQTHDCHLSGQPLRLFHASQIGVHHRVHQDARDKHAAMFENTEFTGFGKLPAVVGYADIHDCFMTWVGDKLLFNVGSVGNPLESNRASYALLEGDPDDAAAPLRISFARVAYDIERAIRDAREAGAPWADDYAHELRTATYIPRAGRPPWPTDAAIKKGM